MQVLVLAAPSQSAGRTMLAGRLAVRAEQAGAGPGILLDADPSEDLWRWAEGQTEPRPIAERWDESCTASELRKLEAAGAGLVVVDAPQPDQRAMFDQTLSVADLALVVVRPEEEDLTRIGGIVSQMETKGLPFIFVINRVRPDGDMATATAIALAQQGTVCPVVVPEFPELAAAHGDDARGAGDGDAGAPDIARLWDYLAERLDRMAESAAPAVEAVAKPDERRRFARQTFDLAAAYTCGGHRRPCQLKDISIGGVSFRSDTTPNEGVGVILHIPNLGDIEGTIAWRAGHRVGVRFLIVERRKARLIERLSGLVGAGGPASGAPPSEGPQKDLFLKKKKAV
jgi:chromosome partitioning protein